MKDTPKSPFRDIMSEADEPDHTERRFGSGKWEGLRILGEGNKSKSDACSKGEAVSLVRSVGVWGSFASSEEITVDTEVAGGLVRCLRVSFSPV